MESIDGLPAHPLLVHAPVVLVPLVGLVAIALAVRPVWRRRFGWSLVAAAVITLVTTQLAVSSGYAFDEVVAGAADTDQHRALGEATRNLVVVLVLATLLTAVFDRLAGGQRTVALGRAAVVAATAAALSAVLATIWVARTGHEGARLVWEGVLFVALA